METANRLQARTSRAPEPQRWSLEDMALLNGIGPRSTGMRTYAQIAVLSNGLRNLHYGGISIGGQVSRENVKRAVSAGRRKQDRVEEYAS